MSQIEQPQWQEYKNFLYLTQGKLTLVKLNAFDENFRLLAHQKGARWNALLRAWAFKQSIEQLHPALDILDGAFVQKNEHKKTLQFIHDHQAKRLHRIAKHQFENFPLLELKTDNPTHLPIFTAPYFSIHYDTTNEHFLLQFPYNGPLIEQIKQLRGSRFAFEDKIWKIPLNHIPFVTSLTVELLKEQRDFHQQAAASFATEQKDPLAQKLPQLSSLFSKIQLDTISDQYVFTCIAPESSPFYEPFFYAWHQSCETFFGPPKFLPQRRFFQPNPKPEHNPHGHLFLHACAREHFLPALQQLIDTHQPSLQQLVPIQFSFQAPPNEKFYSKSVHPSCIYIDTKQYQAYYLYAIDHFVKKKNILQYSAKAHPIDAAETKKMLQNPQILKTTAIISNIAIGQMASVLEALTVSEQTAESTPLKPKSMRL